MVVCKFFLQGTCKFGDFCKFDHQLNENFNSIQNKNNTSILRQSHFAATPQQAKPANSNVDITTLVKSVVNDMTVAEKGGQWLLSSYAPFKEKPAFPGFEDHSFEEIRLGYYEAAKNGTLEQYKQQVQLMLQQAMLKLKSLQSPSPDIVNLLKSIYNTPPSSHSSGFGSIPTSTNNTFNNAGNTTLLGQQQTTSFGQQSGSSIFAQANQALFGKQPQNQFGGTSNIFGSGPQTTSIFGGSTNNPPFNSGQPQNQISTKNIFSQVNPNITSGSSIFGGQQAGMQSNANPIFNYAQSGNSIFGGLQGISSVQNVQQNTSTPFGTQPQASGNIFNKQPSSFEQTNMFATQNSVSSFGQNVPQTGFGSTPVNQIFGSSNVQNVPQTTNFPTLQNQPQTIGNTNKTSIFTQQSAATSIFSQQSQQPNSNSPFGQVSNQSSNIFGNKLPTEKSHLILNREPIDYSIYSKLEELTEEEIKWFENDDLDITNIPEKPPTYEMCFKT